MLKTLVFTALLVAGGYYAGATGLLNGKTKKADYAKCELDSTGRRGADFLRTFSGGNANPSVAVQDAADRNFMIWCMQSKGHDFQEMTNSDGSLNKSCWWDDNGSKALPEAQVEFARCFD